MKLTAKVKLVTTPEQHVSLRDTLERANAACNWISEQAWAAKTFGQFALHKLTYHQTRDRFNLAAQMVVRCIAKVADAYKLNKSVKATFRKHGAIAYDDRILRWKIKQLEVSISTVDGRETIPFQCGERQLALLAVRQGESELLFHRGIFYLAACCNVEEPDPIDTDDFLGVDFGIAQIASDSDGTQYSGSTVKSVRHRHRRLRTKLQKKCTRSAKRRLKQLSGQESRFARDVNHCVSKQIVAHAKGTNRGIAIEDLKGITDRVTVGRNQRAVLHSWAFFQLRTFLEYKSKVAGIPLVTVDPRNTSRTCSECGHCDKKNRRTQERFCCLSCGYMSHADINAAVNIRGRALVNAPNVAGCAA